MAPRELFPAILALVFFAAASAVLCREEASHATATLDVAAALSSAAAAVSLDFRSKQSLLQQEQAKDGSRGFSVRLHPREYLRSPSHSDYRALTLSRLSRDESRVKSLNSRLQLAIHGVKRSDLKPLVQEVLLPSAAGFSGQIISGTSQGSGEYFSRIEIGTPPKSQYMVLDTGSDVTWTQCAPCADCYQQADPIFDPSLSSTFSRLSCQSSQCRQLEVSACRNDSCFYQVSYGDGSYTVGEFSTETVTLGAKSVPRVALGCGHDNEGLFVGAAGLLGLGGGALSFPKQVSAASFSYCLVDRDSTASSTLEFDSPASSAVSAPLLRNRKESTFYYLGLTGISVGGRMLSIPPSAFAMDEESGQGGVILDSGTSVSRLHADAYASLRDAFRRGTASLPPALAVALFDTCYDLAGRDSVVVPSVSLHFPGGKSLRLPAKNYLIPVDSIGTFCLAFAPTNSGVSIIGNVQQQGTRVSFDLANSLVSFSPNQC